MLVIIALVLMVLTGFSDAVMDTLQFHYDKSIFKSNPKQHFWNPIISCANKYKKDLKTLRFIGSTSSFTFTTFIIFICIGLIALITDKLLSIAFYVVVLRIVFGLMFTYSYNKLLKIKNGL